MKRISIFSAAAVLLSASASHAADVINAAPVPTFTWSGFYIGVNGGYGGGTFKHPFSVTDPTTVPPTTLLNGSVDLNASGFLGGVQAGYNFQYDRMIYGIEADFQGSSIDSKASLNLNGGGASISGQVGTKVDWFGTVRGRIGFTPFDRFMAYGTGGLAYGHVKSYASGDAFGGSFAVSKSNTKAGWTVGAGIEYAVTDHLSFKTEYLFTDLGKSTLYDGDLFGAHANLKNDVNFHTVRVGLNYKF